VLETCTFVCGKTEYVLISFCWRDGDERDDQAGEGATRHAIVIFEPQCDTGKDFFAWIRRNPLKRGESTKGIQGNASFFPWIYLLLLAFIGA